MNLQKLTLFFTLFLFILQFTTCSDTEEKKISDSRKSLSGADVYIKNFNRTSYKKGKVMWKLQCSEAYVFVSKVKKKNEKKNIAKEKRNFLKLNQDAKIQSTLVKSLVEDNIANFNVEGKTVIINFKLDHYENGKFQTKIIGKYGYIINSTKDLHIENNVVAKSIEGRILKSDYLNYNSETEKLNTLAPVHIEAEEGIIEGIGMEANTNLSWIKILRPVGLANRNKGSF